MDIGYFETFWPNNHIGSIYGNYLYSTALRWCSFCKCSRMDPMGTNINSSFIMMDTFHMFIIFLHLSSRKTTSHIFQELLGPPRISSVFVQETFAKAAFALLDSQIPRNTKASLPAVVQLGSDTSRATNMLLDYPWNRMVVVYIKHNLLLIHINPMFFGEG